ncbi:MAG: prolyl oligopeptidase family serine peptidase [Verrucomicrobiota bacterium]
MIFRIFFVVLAISFTSVANETNSHSKISRLERSNLLLFHESNGKVAQGKLKKDWEKRRAEILRAMQEVMGPLPVKEKRCPLSVQTIEEVDGGSYIRKLITYQAEPNSRTPAYLLIPKKALEKNAQVRAILCLHPTDMQLGHKVVVGLGGKEDRSYASELAERGFVTLSPAYPQMANYAPDLKALGYESGTMKAIWDNSRGIDFLESLPFVKRDGVAAIGHSLGGHNSIYTAVFDSRVKVIVSSCGFDSYLDYMDGNIKGWTSERYMPKLKNYSLAEIPFDFHEMIAALSPRPVFVNAPTGDTNFKWQSVDRVVAAAKEIYGLDNAGKNLRVEHPECGHDFPGPVREKAYKFIEDNLP